MREMTLRGLAVSRYGSMKAMAGAVGWSYRKTRDVLLGKQPPSGKDIELLANTLGIMDRVVFMDIFFPNVTTM